MNKPHIIKHRGQWAVVGAPKIVWLHDSGQELLFVRAWRWCHAQNKKAAQ